MPDARSYIVARTLLDAVVAWYANAGVDLPARQFVCDGLPAWDCEQLCSWVDRVFVGRVDAEEVKPQDCLHERVARIGLLLVRCTPNKLADSNGRPKLPPADAIEEAARVVLLDGELVEDAVLDAIGVDDLGGHQGVAFESWQRQGPDGGFSGGLLFVRVALSTVTP